VMTTHYEPPQIHTSYISPACRTDAKINIMYF